MNFYVTFSLSSVWRKLWSSFRLNGTNLKPKVN